MAWKKVYREETEAAAHVIKFDNAGCDEPCMVIPIKQSVGKRVRITVEEEVNECCEKWRGLTVGNDNRRDCSRWLRVGSTPRCAYRKDGFDLHGPVVYCPECGSKL